MSEAKCGIDVKRKSRISLRSSGLRNNGGTDGASSTPHPVGDAAKILGYDIPVAPRLEIVFLQGAVFGRAGDEGRLQPEFLGGLEIVVVGGDHHHLLRR